MNTKLAKLLASSNVAIELEQSQYGLPEPRICVRVQKGLRDRLVHAALLALAAEVELATGASDHWIVKIEHFGYAGEVALELLGASDEEAARGMALLKKVASALKLKVA